jgi:hypothetical protein
MQMRPTTDAIDMIPLHVVNEFIRERATIVDRCLKVRGGGGHTARMV